MCGRPIEPGDLSDADRYALTMTVMPDGTDSEAISLAIPGQSGRFRGPVPLSNSPGLPDHGAWVRPKQR